MQITWLEQSEDHLAYTLGGLPSLSNSPKSILGRVNNYTYDQTRNDCFLTLAPEEDNRLCRLANCDEFENDVTDHDDSLKIVWLNSKRITAPILFRSMAHHDRQELVKQATELQGFSCPKPSLSNGLLYRIQQPSVSSNYSLLYVTLSETSSVC